MIDCAIYALTAEDEPTIPRYIGRARNPKSRLAQHWNGPAISTAPWINGLRDAGRILTLRVLFDVHYWDSFTFEAQTIHSFRKYYDLLNAHIPILEPQVKLPIDPSRFHDNYYRLTAWSVGPLRATAVSRNEQLQGYAKLLNFAFDHKFNKPVINPVQERDSN